MPDALRQILSTKILPQTVLHGAFVDGMQIDCHDFIQITYKPADSIMAAMENIRDNDVLIFTSKHAVFAAKDELKDKRNGIYCLSGATKHAVEKHLPHCQIIAYADNADNLIKQIDTTSSHTHFFFCGDKSLPIIPNFLARNGMICPKIIVYENHSSPAKMQKAYNGVMFFSPSGAESFFSVNEIAANVVAVAIGSTTAKAVQRFHKNVLIAEKPDSQTMLTSLKNFFDTFSGDS
ncbi:MAG: uroporphyrinogen-III synthase [Niabella sp.]